MDSTILIARNYGKGDVLEFYTQGLPAIGEGMVRVKVKASGINPIDARRMTGEFKHGELPQTFGTEYAGIIAEVHPSITNWKVGDEVLGSGGVFTHATIIDVPALNLVRKPENISWEIAGTLAGVSQTAMTIFSEMGPANSLLIHGASGGVGSVLIQIAKEKGLTVIATASERNQSYLADLGAIPVVYGTGLLDRINEIHPSEFDVAIDMSGTDDAIQVSLEKVKTNGFIGTIAGKAVSSPRVHPIWVKRNVSNLKYVIERVASGDFKWEVDRAYPFEKAAEAYDDILTGHTRGKSVLVFND